MMEQAPSSAMAIETSSETIEENPVAAPDAVADAPAVVDLATPKTSAFMADVYEAIRIASTCVGASSSQFPGRDKILQVMRTMQRAPESTGRSTGFSTWRNAVEFLKRRNLVHTVPNSGTFVSETIGTIGGLLDLLDKGIPAEEEREFLSSLRRVRRSGSNSYSRDTLQNSEDEYSADGSSEEEIAAGILQDLKFTANVDQAQGQAKRGGRRQGRRKASAQGGARAPGAAAMAATIDFELKGPWAPKDAQEEADYQNFLNLLVKANNNQTNWSHSRLKKSVAAIFGVLHAAPRGLPRIELRNAARTFVGDTGLLDYTIKILVDMDLCGFTMKRVSDDATGKLLYFLEFSETGDRLQRLPAHTRTWKETLASEENRPPPQMGTGSHIVAERNQRESGKRKVSSPARYKDYSKYDSPAHHYQSYAKLQTADPLTPLAPSVKRSRYFLPSAPKPVAVEGINPMPPPLDQGHAHREERVSAESGRMILGTKEAMAPAEEVEALVKDAAAQAPNPELKNAWVNQCLQSEIWKEVTGAYHDVRQLRGQVSTLV